MMKVSPARDRIDEVYRLRFAAFDSSIEGVGKQYPDGRVIDEVDTTYADTEQFICEDESGKLVGAFRLNSGGVLPYERYWSLRPPSGSVEISRLVIDPLVWNPLKRYDALYSMLGTVATRVVETEIKRIYTTADPSLVDIYRKLLGFRQASDELRAIPPGVMKNIALLRLCMNESTLKKARRVFMLR